MPNASEQLRKALLTTNYSIADISRATGVHRVNVSQFRSGRRDLPLASMERIADYLGLDIVIVPKPKAK